MKSFNALATLEEARRLLVIAAGCSALTAGVLLLDRIGGPFTAGLGVISAAFAYRLLRMAADHPVDADTPASSTPRPRTKANPNR